ncbi:MAG: FkbM family methyltransferase [Terriglobia bacterium]
MKKHLSSTLHAIRWHIGRIGTAATVKLWLGFLARKACRKLGGRLPAIPLRPSSYSHPIYLRLGASDSEVFHQVFILGEYDAVFRLEDPKLIIDCGANVGYTSVCFLNHFPSVRVLAIEPDPSGAELCRRNLKPYGERARLLQAAVWSEPASLVLQPHPLGHCGFEYGMQVRAPAKGEPGTTAALDVRSLIAMSGNASVDLLKVDIEGSEAVLFARNCESWLPNIRNIVIELHNARSREAFAGALRDYEFDSSACGELTFCWNLRQKPGCEPRADRLG